MPQRLDTWLVQRGLLESREKAQLAIQSHLVQVNGQLARKASQQVGDEDTITLEAPPLRYVSRGGLKLEKAIQAFQLDFKGKTVLDVGASTGGFTDCALQHGALHVTAIDVGAGQLHHSLLNNETQVLSLEKTDIRELSPAALPYCPVDFVVIDVSFISLGYIFPFVKNFLAENGQMIVLIKPQFEMGAKVRTKNGIVKDERAQKQAVDNVRQYAQEQGLNLVALTETTIEAGENRNKEFLGLFQLMVSDKKV